MPAPDFHQAVVDFFAGPGVRELYPGFRPQPWSRRGAPGARTPHGRPCREELAAGNVITIEPGLYYPGTGGVRLEDIGAVTAKGFDTFTQFSEELVL